MRACLCIRHVPDTANNHAKRQSEPADPRMISAAHETWLHYDGEIVTFGLGQIVSLHPESTYSKDR